MDRLTAGDRALARTISGMNENENGTAQDPRHPQNLRAFRELKLLTGGYLALHDACVDAGNLNDARSAIERGIPRLVRRLRGLADTPYAHAFLTGLDHNAGLIAAADSYGLVPEEALRVLGRRG